LKSARVKSRASSNLRSHRVIDKDEMLFLKMTAAVFLGVLLALLAVNYIVTHVEIKSITSVSTDVLSGATSLGEYTLR